MRNVYYAKDMNINLISFGKLTDKNTKYFKRKYSKNN